MNNEIEELLRFAEGDSAYDRPDIERFSCPVCPYMMLTHYLEVASECVQVYCYCDGEVHDIETVDETFCRDPSVNELSCKQCGLKIEFGADTVEYKGEQYVAEEFFNRLNFLVITGSPMRDD